MLIEKVDLMNQRIKRKSKKKKKPSIPDSGNLNANLNNSTW